MSVVDWVCKKFSLESATEQLSAITISRQQVLPASLTHAQTLPLAVRICLVPCTWEFWMELKKIKFKAFVEQQ